MANIDDLKVSISQMSAKEVFTLIMETRKRRRVRKKSLPSKRKYTPNQRILANLTPEDAKVLLSLIDKKE